MSPADGSTRLFHNPTLQISPKYIPPPVPKKEITKLPPKDKEPVQQPFKKNQQETERPKTMKALKILSIATTTEHGLDIAEAKKIIAKEEADARISLKVSKQRVQDENDFLENNWSVGDSIGSSVGDEPICG
ncbi:hypothetical protein HK100_001766 [Physocladia obscura]|uniref:Uncharacterized protein n=1 Tax=Physocladia obscura TaxID=109957 RepID=A0AAD5SWQ5_9FUNG|nr:hypothetical protein HK100_001766 [Physocladia obscura]